jgi:hypothetical protein
MDLKTGKFTAPRTGTYFFSFAGMAQFPSSSLVYLGVQLHLNGGLIGTCYIEEGNTVAGQDSPFTLKSTLNMKKGDQVWLQIYAISSPRVSLFDNTNHHSHFMGFMLEEDIASSISSGYDLKSDSNNFKKLENTRRNGA